MAAKKIKKTFHVTGKLSRERAESRTSQTMRLFIILHAKGYVRTKDLMDELEISERQAQRLLYPLKVQGYLVEEPGERGKWVFNSVTHSWEKMNVTNHDATTLAFIYKFSKVFGSQISESVFQSIDKLFSIDETEHPFFIITSRVKQPNTKLEFYKDLYDAILARNKVLLTYETNDSKGKEKQVKAWPIAFVMSDGMWYLGYLPEPEEGKKQGVRTVRYTHIRKVQALPEEKFERPDWIKPALKEARNIWFNNERCIEVVLEVDNFIKDYFLLSDYFPRQEIVNEGPRTFRVKSMICHELEAIPNIMRFMPYIKVIEPPSLKASVEAKVREWLKK